MENKTCQQCGLPIVIAYRVTPSYWRTRRFCSPACRDAARRGSAQVGGKRGTDPASRFWDKVQPAGPDECWPWAGSRDRFGYGVLFGSKVSKPRWVKAHRLSLELALGRPLADGEQALHTCDNPPCVNPAHLFVGDPSVNMADRDAKGRGADRSNARNGRARLSDEQVADIRAAYSAGGVTQQQLAQRFGVSDGHISRLVRGQQRM